MRKQRGGKIKFIGVLLISSLTYINCHSATAQNLNQSKHSIVLSLNDAVLLALRNNPQIKQDRIQRVLDKFNLLAAKYQFQPQYQFNTAYNYIRAVNDGKTTNSRQVTVTPEVSLQNHYGTKFDMNTSTPESNGVFTPQWTFTITQPLIQGFGKPIVDVALNNAKDTEINAQLALKNGIMTTVSQVINDYLTLVQDYRNLEVDQLSLKNYQQTVTNDHNLISAGQMARTDIVQANAQVESQQVSLQNDYNSIDNDRAQLLADLGLPPQTNITVPTNIDFKAMAKQMMGGTNLLDVDTAEKIALGNNISYQTNIIMIRTLRRSLLQAHDARRWKLNMTATETLGAGNGVGNSAGFNTLTNGADHAEGIQLNLAIPIDDVPAQQAEIEAKVGLEKAMISLNEQKRALLENVDTQYRSVLSNLRSLQLGENALELQKQTVYIAQEKQIAGRISTFEVLSTQKDLSTQAQSVVQSEINYLKSIVAYQLTLGNLLEAWHIQVKY